MNSPQVRRLSILMTASTLLYACGGGGGGGAAPSPVIPPVLPPPPVSVAPATLDVAITGKFGVAIMQVVSIARDLSDTVRVGIPSLAAIGVSESNCTFGGTSRLDVSADRLSVTEFYQDCRPPINGANTVTLNGMRTITWSNAIGGGPVEAIIEFTDLRARNDSGETETSNGTIQFNRSIGNAIESLDNVEFNMTINNSLNGELILEGLQFEIENSSDFSNNLAGVVAASGSLAQREKGKVELGYDSTREAILFDGAGTGVGSITTTMGDLFFSFQEESASPASAFLLIDPRDLGEIDVFDDTRLLGPSKVTDFILDFSSNAVFLQPNELRFSLRRNFYDRDGDLLTLSLMPIDVVLTPRSGSGLAETVAFDDPRVNVTVDQIEAGIFSVNSMTDSEIVEYRFEAVVTDPDGLESQQALPVVFNIYLDSDNDSDADRFDFDDDNDGVFDGSDRFPLDASESSDNDFDGVGDNADTDDDNDNTLDANDAYPFDRLCFLESDGNGQVCTLRQLSLNEGVTMDKNGIVYFYDQGNLGGSSNALVYRYDSTTSHFLDPIVLDPSVVSPEANTNQYRMSYVRNHDALYVIYGDTFMGDIGVSKIDLNDANFTETLFKLKSDMTSFINGVSSFDDYAVVSEQEIGQNAQFVRFSYDSEGNQIDSYSSTSGPFTTGSGGFPLMLTKLVNYCESGVTVDLSNGTFFEFTNLNFFNCRISGAPVVSPDFTMAISPNLKIIDSSLNEIASVDTQERPRSSLMWRWSNDGIYIPSSAGIEVFSSDGTPITILSEPHNGILGSKVLQSGDLIVTILSASGLTVQRNPLGSQ